VPESTKAPGGVLAVQTLQSHHAEVVNMAGHAAWMSNDKTAKATIFTNGDKILKQRIDEMAPRERFDIETRRIARLVDKEGLGIEVHFETGGNPKVVGFLMHQPKVIPNGDFIDQKLGLEQSPFGSIKAKAPDYQTNVRGLFAAGDCISRFKSVLPLACESGHRAAVSAMTQLQAEEFGLPDGF